ncbi:unnamed protein product [Meloidogyne enterolobii]|uniref:Uncharacterized protein n=1 Tax=Meloidogyne enterolobii TaxID=390850 RepID=A0ACB1AWZ9_MELEN
MNAKRNDKAIDHLFLRSVLLTILYFSKFSFFTFLDVFIISVLANISFLFFLLFVFSLLRCVAVSLLNFSFYFNCSLIPASFLIFLFLKFFLF